MDDVRQWLMSLIGSYRAPVVIGVAARLELVDHVIAGTNTLQGLAQATGVLEERLHQLLRALVAYGLLYEQSGGSFGTTAAGALLCRSHPESLHGSAVYASAVSVPAFSYLYQCLTVPESAFELRFGQKFYDVVNQDAEMLEAFTDMLRLTKLDAAIATAYDFGGRHIVDVGCGNGAALAAILRQHPDATGILFEREELEALSRSCVTPEIDERISFVGGSFMESAPAGGDIYMLCRVLANWCDNDVIRILKTVRQAMRPTAQLVIVEQVLPGTVEFGSSVPLGSLDLMVNFGGRLRTKSEIDAALRSAALELQSSIPLPASEGASWHMLFAQPATEQE